MEFEKKLDALTKLVEKLEDKSISLEEGIALYEKGVALTKDCLNSLNESKNKITVIRKEMDRLIEEPFNE